MFHHHWFVASLFFWLLNLIKIIELLFAQGTAGVKDALQMYTPRLVQMWLQNQAQNLDIFQG